MTPLRRKRLLVLASGHANHKRWYEQYCELMYTEDPSPVGWVIGTAYLTEHGKKELDKLR
jgi:hypothetical protein